MTYKYINLTILLMNIYQSALSERGDMLYHVSDNTVSADKAFYSCNLASPPLVSDSESYMLKLNANNDVASQVDSYFQHKWWVGYYKVQVDFKNVGCLLYPGQWNYTYTCKQGIACELWNCYTLCDSDYVGFRRGNSSCISEVSFCKNSFCFCLTENSNYDKTQTCDGKFYFAGVYKRVVPGTNENLTQSYGVITDEELNDKTINYEQGYVNTFAGNKLMFDHQTAQFPSLCEHGTRHTTNLTTARITLATTRADTSYAYGTSKTNIHTNLTRNKGTRHTTNLTTARITLATTRADTSYAYGTSKTNIHTNLTGNKGTRHTTNLTTAENILATTRADTSYAYGTSNTNIHTNQTGSQEPHSRIDRIPANIGSTSARLDTTDNYGLSQTNSFMNQNRGKDIGMYAGSVAGGVLLIAAIAGVCIWYKRRRGNDDRREKKSFELENVSDSVNEKEIDSVSTEESATQISNHPDVQPTAHLYSTVVKKKFPLDENDYDTTNSNFKITSGATDKTYDRLGEAKQDTYDHVGEFHKSDSTREGEMNTYSHVVEIDSAREVQYDKAGAVQRHGQTHYIGNTTSVESNNDGLYDTTCVSQLRGDMIDDSDYSHVKTNGLGQQKQPSFTDCEDDTYNHIALKNKSK